VRWIVGPDDGQAVWEVLARAGADADAVRDGRVFVGRRRVRSDSEPLCEGDVIQVAPPGRTAEAQVGLLLQTSEYAAADKPAGMPTIPDQRGASHTLLAVLARLLDVPTASLHPASRLDRDVSGVVVFARTNAARARLARTRAAGCYERRYIAIAADAPPQERGAWSAPIGRARDPRLRAVAGRAAVPATTHFRVCARAPSGAALLAIAPITGRTHQIRVHAAHAGAPLLGDRAYGGPSRLTLSEGRVMAVPRIALHAARAVIPDEAGTLLAIQAPIPRDLITLWSELGGESEVWEVAASCALG
jgi:23S rRNA pseudouridine1911/1915/1917 synthase